MRFLKPVSVFVAVAVSIAGGAAPPLTAHPEAGESAAPPPFSADWSPIGPNGGAGAIAQAPSDTDRAVLIPSYAVGPWLTEDAGSSWRQLPDPPEVRNHNDANRVLIDPGDASHWWYAGTAAMTAQSVIMETRDGGETWSENVRFAGEMLAFLRTTDHSRMVVVTTTGRSTAEIHTGDGVTGWVSQEVDTGESLHGVALTDTAVVMWGDKAMWRWDEGATAPDEIYRVGNEATDQIWDAASTDDAILVRDLGRGIVASMDGGKSWTERDYPYGTLSISAADGTVYISRSGHGPRVVDLTSDGGLTFTALPLPDDGSVPQQFTVWRDGSLTSSNPRSGLYRSADRGRSWTRIGVSASSGMALLSRPDSLLVGTDFGLARTDLPVTGPEWGPTGGEARVGTVTSTLASASDGQTIWKSVDARSNQLEVFASTDGGRRWELRSSTIGSARAMMVHPADADLVVVAWEAGDQCGLRTTHDGGRTWTTSISECFDAIVGDPADPDRVWFGGPGGLLRSDDAGRTGVEVADMPATAVLLDRHRIIVGGTELHVSEDDGETFTQSSVSPPGTDTSITSIVRSGPRLYAGSTSGANRPGSGVQMSEDGGRTWSDFSDGIQNSEILSLAVSVDGTTLFAGTRGGGVHATALPPRVTPSGVNDIAHTKVSVPVRIDVLSNDSGGDLPIDPVGVALRSMGGPEDWTSRLVIAGEGTFVVDVTGSVTFTPEAGFVGRTEAVGYRFSNTDGDRGEATLSVIVDPSTDPGDGDGDGDGDGGGEGGDGGSSDGAAGEAGAGGSDWLATTGASPLAYVLGAAVLLLIGGAITLWSRMRHRRTR